MKMKRKGTRKAYEVKTIVDCPKMNFFDFFYLPFMYVYPFHHNNTCVCVCFYFFPFKRITKDDEDGRKEKPIIDILDTLGAFTMLEIFCGQIYTCCNTYIFDSWNKNV